MLEYKLHIILENQKLEVHAEDVKNGLIVNFDVFPIDKVDDGLDSMLEFTKLAVEKINSLKPSS